MKNILVGVDAADIPEPWHTAVALAAGKLCRQFNAHVDVVGVDHPELRAPVAVGEAGWAVLEVEGRFPTEADVQAEVFRPVFLDSGLCPTAHWGGMRTPFHLGTSSRAFDLCILARPDETALGPSQAPVESVLFDGGVPLLLMPGDSRTLGSRVIVSWMDTPESGRAVRAGLPLLKSAEHVSVLAIKNARVASEQAGDIVHFLSTHGVSAELKELPMGRSVAETTVSFASEMGADLLIRGAYTETRLQRFIFGDATRHLISNVRVPMLLCH